MGRRRADRVAIAFESSIIDACPLTSRRRTSSSLAVARCNGSKTVERVRDRPPLPPNKSPPPERTLVVLLLFLGGDNRPDFFGIFGFT